MDLNSIISIGVIFLPFLFAMYLFIAKIRFSLVNKKVLNYGLTSVNTICLLGFLYWLIQIFCFQNEFKTSFQVLNINNLTLTFGLQINQANIPFLAILSIFNLFIALFAVLFFKKKKQFLFTKQRFYIFLSILISNLYLLFASINLFQVVICMFIQSAFIYFFAFFDIAKINAKYDISRFYRISVLADVAALVVLLFLYRWAILSKGYVESLNINLSDFNIFISYLYGVLSGFELKILCIFIFFAILIKSIAFPFNCFYTFFANSSDVLYLPVSICINNFVAMYLYVTTLPILRYIAHFEPFVLFAAILTILTSLFCILFEKNIKIIFGYLISIVNAVFLYLILKFEYSLYIYFAVLFFILLVLSFLFSKEKLNFPARLINKQKGFYLEKMQIILFETLPCKIGKLLVYLNEKILQNLFKPFAVLLDFLIKIFVVKSEKITTKRILVQIFLVISMFIVITVLVILFGGSEFGE